MIDKLYTLAAIIVAVTEVIKATTGLVVAASTLIPSILMLICIIAAL